MIDNKLSKLIDKIAKKRYSSMEDASKLFEKMVNSKDDFPDAQIYLVNNQQVYMNMGNTSSDDYNPFKTFVEMYENTVLLG